MATESANLQLSNGPAVYFSWTEEHKHILAKYVHRNFGFKKTTQSFKEKFEIILFQLKQKPEFYTLNIAWNALQVAFKRDQAEVLNKFGI
jgi:hypothetical protein